MGVKEEVVEEVRDERVVNVIGIEDGGNMFGCIVVK